MAKETDIGSSERDDEGYVDARDTPSTSNKMDPSTAANMKAALAQKASPHPYGDTSYGSGDALAKLGAGSMYGSK